MRYSAKISLFSALSKVKALKRTTLPFNLKFKLSLIVTVKAKFKCISSTDCGNLVCLQLHSGNARDMKYSIAIEPTTVIPASGSVFSRRNLQERCRFLQEPSGKAAFSAGNHRLMEAVFPLENAWIFPVISVLFLLFPSGNGWKPLEKSENFRMGILPP